MIYNYTIQCDAKLCHFLSYLLISRKLSTRFGSSHVKLNHFEGKLNTGGDTSWSVRASEGAAAAFVLEERLPSSEVELELSSARPKDIPVMKDFKPSPNTSSLAP